MSTGLNSKTLKDCLAGEIGGTSGRVEGHLLAHEIVEGLELLASVNMDFGVEQRRYVLNPVLDVRYLPLTPEVIEDISLCDRHIHTSQL